MRIYLTILGDVCIEIPIEIRIRLECRPTYSKTLHISETAKMHLFTVEKVMLHQTFDPIALVLGY